jgi:DNA-binding NarL/FixJ family response regulator
VADIRVLIADGHPAVRDGLRATFAVAPGFEVLGEAGSGDDAVALAESLRPDVVLMGLRMPELDGLAVIARLAAAAPHVRVLVLTTPGTEAGVLLAIEAGAAGHLRRDAPREELFRAVRAAARGEAVLPAPVAARLVGRAPAAEPLTARELEVLGTVARGLTNREAARRLFISEATVKSHLLHAYAKLGVNNRAAAVAAAFERGLLTPRGNS